jgi:hypothetical protein
MPREELPVSDAPDKKTYASLYSGNPRWEIGKPQKAFIDVADRSIGSVVGRWPGLQGHGHRLSRRTDQAGRLIVSIWHGSLTSMQGRSSLRTTTP